MYIRFRVVNFILAILIGLLILPSLLGNTGYALAAENYYTSALEDLQKDENFKEEDYPVIKDDYSLKVIQIAESNDNELFVYVYQPSGNKEILATKISISQSVDNEGFHLYNLEYLNSSATLFKYKVNNISFTDEEIRYYNISEIFRLFDSAIDEKLDNGNELTEMAYEVAQIWTVAVEDGETKYSCTGTEVVRITDKYVGFVRYKDGFNLLPTSCDSYYVAFACDRNIDRLIEANLYYTSQTYKYYDYFTGRETYYFDDKVENETHVKYTDKVSFDGSIGLTKHKFTWNRISTVDDFINNENITEYLNLAVIDIGFHQELLEDVQRELADKQWVLRFTETEFTTTVHTGSAQYYVTRGTLIGDIGILELKFETDGVIYNLGVVDNLQTGDPLPDNSNSVTVGLSKTGRSLVGIIALVVLVIIYIKLFSKIIFGDKEPLEKFIWILCLTILVGLPVLLIVLFCF